MQQQFLDHVKLAENRARGFGAMGLWYGRLGQATDNEVRELLRRVRGAERLAG